MEIFQQIIDRLSYKDAASTALEINQVKLGLVQARNLPPVIPADQSSTTGGLDINEHRGKRFQGFQVSVEASPQQVTPDSSLQLRETIVLGGLFELFHVFCLRNARHLPTSDGLEFGDCDGFF